MNEQMKKAIKSGIAYKRWRNRVLCGSLLLLLYVFIGWVVIAAFCPLYLQWLFLVGLLLTALLFHWGGLQYNWNCPRCGEKLPVTESSLTGSPFNIKVPELVGICSHCGYDLMQEQVQPGGEM